MTSLALTDDLFYAKAGLDRGRTEALVAQTLRGADDGELFLEYSQSESLVWDDGKLRSAAFDVTQGFGLRAVAGEATGYWTKGGTGVPVRTLLALIDDVAANG